MPARILLVDDSRDSLLTLQKLLNLQYPDWTVVTAENGEQALQEVRRTAPDLVVTDLQMPQMDGLELLRRLQQERPEIPVILVTGWGSEQIAAQALSEGAASYLPKPVDFPLLAKTMDRLLALRRSNRTGVAVQFFSCFISHSHRDQSFCDKLYDRLRPLEIQLWYSPKDMRGGRTIDDQVRRAILGYDKLLVVLSEHSLQSQWVQTEVLSAKRREMETGQRVLFPIRLVDYDKIQRWSLIDSNTGIDVAREVRRYFIPDFSSWSTQESFDESLRRLVEDLKREEPPPAAEEQSDQSEAPATDAPFGEQLSWLVHDLRNHLSPVRNAVQMLKLMPDDPNVRTFSQNLIERNVANATEVTDKILELSRSMRRAEQARSDSPSSQVSDVDAT